MNAEKGFRSDSDVDVQENLTRAESGIQVFRFPIKQTDTSEINQRTRLCPDVFMKFLIRSGAYLQGNPFR
jgi:hypothetical protein